MKAHDRSDLTYQSWYSMMADNLVQLEKNIVIVIWCLLDMLCFNVL